MKLGVKEYIAKVESIHSNASLAGVVLNNIAMDIEEVLTDKFQLLTESEKIAFLKMAELMTFITLTAITQIIRLKI